jgi:hypothetical protein
MDAQVFESNIKSSVASNLISDNAKEIERVVKYHLYWKFYQGLHYNQANDAFITFNYVRAFIDKINQFLLGDDGFSFKVQGYYSDTVDEVIEDSVGKLIMGVWRKNKHKQLAQELLQMGSVCGDSWIGVFFKDGLGIELKLFDSRKCFPEFTDGDTDNLKSFKVINTLEEGGDYKIMVYVYTKTHVTTWKQKTTQSKNVKDRDMYDYVTTEHGLGKVPVVHFKNKPTSNGYYASSDAEDILKLNKVYNELHQELKGIIDYHSAPTTVVTGATVKNMSRGIGKVWSGLPPEANVFNLGLDVDLSASMEFLDRLKTAMHELSDIPEGVLGKIQSISGTSAAALKLTYQPIYQRAALKGLSYGEGIKMVNDLIMDYLPILKAGGKLTTKETELLGKIPNNFSEEYECAAVWSYGFPIDRMSLLQELQIEFQLDLASIAEALKRLGKNNIPDLLEEIQEDKVKRAKLQQEIAEILGTDATAGWDTQGTDNTQPVN